MFLLEIQSIIDSTEDENIDMFYSNGDYIIIINYIKFLSNLVQCSAVL